MTVAFELHVSPAPRSHRPRKTDSIHPLENSLLNFLLGSAKVSRSTNMAPHGGLQSGTDRDTNFDQSTGLVVERTSAIDRFGHSIMRLHQFREPVYEQLESVGQLLFLPWSIRISGFGICEGRRWEFFSHGFDLFERKEVLRCSKETIIGRSKRKWHGLRECPSTPWRQNNRVPPL